jgi:hypothetical protein
MTAPGTQGEVSPKSMGKTASSAVGSLPDAKLTCLWRIAESGKKYFSSAIL